MAQSTSGRAPFGFRWHEGRLAVVESEAALRRLMCELFLEHQTKAGVAGALNAMGHYTRTGALWGDTTVGRLLSCPSAIGSYQVNKTTKGPDGLRIDLPEDRWEVVPCPSIIDAALWEKVHDLLRDQTDHGSKIPSRAAHALSGLVECLCGSSMQIPTELDKFACTACSTKIPIADLEQIFLRDLHAFAGKHADALAGMLTAQLPDDDLSREARSLKLEMEALEKRIAAAQQSVLDGKMRPNDFSSLLKPLDAKRRSLQSQLKKNQAQVNRRKLDKDAIADPPGFSADELIEILWPRFPLETQQKLARVLIDRYVVSTGRVEIHSRVTSSLLTAAVAQHMESNEPIPPDDPEHIPGERVYISLPPQGQKCAHSGFSRSKLNELILATPRNNFRPLVKSVNSCLPGKQRGNRLIIWASLKAYLKRLE